MATPSQVTPVTVTVLPYRPTPTTAYRFAPVAVCVTVFDEQASHVPTVAASNAIAPNSCCQHSAMIKKALNSLIYQLAIMQAVAFTKMLAPVVCGSANRPVFAASNNGTGNGATKHPLTAGQ